MTPKDKAPPRGKGNGQCLLQFQNMIRCVERTGCAHDCLDKMQAFLECDQAAFKEAERAAFKAGRGMVAGPDGDSDDNTQVVVMEVDLSPIQRSFARQWDAYGKLADDIRNAAKPDRVGNFLTSMAGDMRRTTVAFGAWIVRLFDRDR